MRIVSWNVNGLSALMKKDSGALKKVAEELDADVLCLQETKLQSGAEPVLALREAFPHQYWSCSTAKKGYSGTAVLCRKGVKPESVRYGLGGGEGVEEGRVITVDLGAMSVVNVYVPNSGEGLKRLDVRRKWNTAMAEYVSELDKRKPVVLVGDLNVAHHPIDIHRPKGNERSAGFTEEERADFSSLLERGFVDTWRHFHPEEVGYSYFSYRFNARDNNRGWRLDYAIVPNSLLCAVTSTSIHKEFTGSDHVPISLEIHLGKSSKKIKPTKDDVVE